MMRSQGAAGAELGVTVHTGARDEVRLLRRLADGEPGAFEALYQLYHPRLTRFLGTMVRKPEVVEELVNDTLMAVWRKPSSYNGACKPSTWIFAIAYRKALKARRRIDEPVEDFGAETRPSDEEGPDHQLDRRQVHDALLGAMAQLSAEHRAVVDLTYFHEIGYREIAVIMDCPVDTVKTRMFHARRYLKASLAGSLTDWL